jgi:hypothetical protein
VVNIFYDPYMTLQINEVIYMHIYRKVTSW